MPARLTHASYSKAVFPSQVQAASENRFARLWQLGAALVVMLRSVGIDDVRRGVSSIGFWFVAVFALGGLRFAARARGWMACAEDEPGALRFTDAFSAVLSAESSVSWSSEQSSAAPSWPAATRQAMRSARSASRR